MLCYLLSSYPRWSETFLRLDIRGLLERGLQVKVVSLYPGDCPADSEWPEATVLSPAPPCPATSQAYRLPVPKWLRGRLSLWRHRTLLEKLLAYCRENCITHLHAEFADLPALLASVAARRLGCTYSVGIHAYDVHSCKYPDGMLYRNASFISACNQSAADAFLKKNPRLAPRLHLIHHGLDLDLWKYLGKVDASRMNILFSGRLVAKKGLPILLEAIAILRSRGAAPCLTIVGEGPLEAEIRLQAENLGISRLITWAGRMPQKQIRQVMAHASCLCLPSVVTPNGDRDGIPNVMTEAMAAGLPVVSSLNGSIPEILDASTGWPVPELTPQNLADTLLAMANCGDECEKRRENARRLMENSFDYSKLAAQRAKLFTHEKQQTI